MSAASTFIHEEVTKKEVEKEIEKEEAKIKKDADKAIKAEERAAIRAALEVEKKRVREKAKREIARVRAIRDTEEVIVIVRAQMSRLQTKLDSLIVTLESLRFIG